LKKELKAAEDTIKDLNKEIKKTPDLRKELEAAK
jgi:hypothetical protein